MKKIEYCNETSDSEHYIFTWFFTETYEAAVQKSRIALDTSNVETEEDQDEVRRKKKPRRFEETESSDGNLF
jgi:hypothetical protein